MPKVAFIAVLLIVVAILILAFLHQSAPPSTIPTITVLVTTPTTIAYNQTQQQSNTIQILSIAPEYASNQSFANVSGKKISFAVSFKNVGGMPIYITQGCIQALGVYVMPNSSATIMPNGAGLCAYSAPFQLNPNNSTTYYAPAFANFIINKPGKVTAYFKLTWYTAINANSSGIDTPNSMPQSFSFSKNFTFS